ncbi:Probable protein S-acyltransferase 23 (Probable palmitoyltransferase At2g14255) (Zinc finger DHHC domain-containing protein At2g14255) [Durusdinium trenchii]|uniref:Palmitoyltransferase n=1 Tax=Durusdinium trenchii TaxID=1381693 RepID=A0ABP0K683_9DINO
MLVLLLTPLCHGWNMAAVLLEAPWRDEHLQAEGLVLFLGQLYSMRCFLKLCSSDPGYCALHTSDEQRRATQASYGFSEEYVAVAMASENDPAGWRKKACVICGHLRQERCKHCRHCARCVRRFDHHCPWLGNCIGEQNLYVFFRFLASTLLFAGSPSRSLLLALQLHWEALQTLQAGFRAWLVTAILFIDSFLAIFVTCVLLQQAGLAVAGITRYEGLKAKDFRSWWSTWRFAQVEPDLEVLRWGRVMGELDERMNRESQLTSQGFPPEAMDERVVAVLEWDIFPEIGEAIQRAGVVTCPNHGKWARQPCGREKGREVAGKLALAFSLLVDRVEAALALEPADLEIFCKNYPEFRAALLPQAGGKGPAGPTPWAVAWAAAICLAWEEDFDQVITMERAAPAPSPSGASAPEGLPSEGLCVYHDKYTAVELDLFRSGQFVLSEVVAEVNNEVIITHDPDWDPMGFKQVGFGLAKAARIAQVAWRVVLDKLGSAALEALLSKCLKELHMGIIHKLYGLWYNIFPIYVDPRDVGHSGASRARVYIIMAHKQKVAQRFDCRKMYARISAAMKALVATTPKDYFVADKIDIQLEAARVARAVELDYLLNHREQKAVEDAKQIYWKKFHRDPMKDENLVVFLGDNPKRYLCWSGLSEHFLLVSHSDSFSCAMPWRLRLCGREKLSTLGFPVSGDTALSMGVPRLPVSDPARASQISGNCMHFSCILVIQLISLCCFTRTDSD